MPLAVLFCLFLLTGASLELVGPGTPLRLSEQEIEMTVELHNAVRSAVLPPSSNMQLLVRSD